MHQTDEGPMPMLSCKLCKYHVRSRDWDGDGWYRTCQHGLYGEARKFTAGQTINMPGYETPPLCPLIEYDDQEEHVAES